jgi:membrane-associated phospholipid phosphatase
VDRRPSLARDPWSIVGIACALAFVVVAAIVNGQGTVFLDAPVTAVVRGLPIPVDAWRAITQAGGWLLVAVGAALVLGLVAAGRARMALVVAVALVAAALFTDLAKDWVGRPRPLDPVADAGGYSFPSGHTLNSTVTYGIAALMAWRSSLPRGARVGVTAVLLALIACVGLSRIALGVHYPSDVVAGWLAGTAIVAVVAMADRADRADRAVVSRSSRRR